MEKDTPNTMEITESVGKATNDGLKTTDEAAADDQAEETTPDAVD